MNANERKQRVNAILDTLRNAEGQLDLMRFDDSEPQQAMEFHSQAVARIGLAIDHVSNWLNFEKERLS